ncbi:Mitogen-activated protein kinase 7 [Bienertia sinuspersici]
MLRELTILRHLRHENVIALKDVMVTSTKSSFKEVYMVYELMDCGLHQIIRSPQPLSNHHYKYFLFQPANLPVNGNYNLRICDFAVSRTFKGEGEFMARYVVTRWYRALEFLLRDDNYGASVDVWFVGCIFGEMLRRKPLFPGTNSINQLQLIINILGSSNKSDLKFIMVQNVRSFLYLHSLPHSRGVHLAALYPHVDHLALNLL